MEKVACEFKIGTRSATGKMDLKKERKKDRRRIFSQGISPFPVFFPLKRRVRMGKKRRQAGFL